MKAIRLPEKSDDFIDVADVTCQNLIIVKKFDKVMGFIVFWEDEWGFQCNSLCMDNYYWNYTLLDTIKQILTNYPDYTFFIED